MSSQAHYTGKILVVDDSLDNLLLIQTILEGEGHNVITVEDGYSALNILQTSPCDLVLLDVMMPEMDGYEVTRRIREEMNLSQYIPILLITAHDTLNVAKGLDIGADDFVGKPVSVEELLARVRSLLRLKHSMDERDEIARQRHDFVSRLTHDLRTPLIAADRMLALFEQGALGKLSSQMQEAITIMARSNSNLLTMVNTLLEVYRFEAGQKTLAVQPVRIQKLLQDVIGELTPLAIEKKLAINLEVSSNFTQNRVNGDHLDLRRLFTNLIGNAIKFTNVGEVTICLDFQPQLDTSKIPHLEENINENGYIVIEVKDTGSGIPASELSTIFERFRQGSNKTYGSGLGLYLSRRIVAAHNGIIFVNSELGKGSIFTVCLPIESID